ncbi:hypothetical protein FRC16_008258 [Serendipita sp. 398]|nr:hypothetical protein FRC16_008258 [Serendipita sp. 398]
MLMDSHPLENNRLMAEEEGVDKDRLWDYWPSMRAGRNTQWYQMPYEAKGQNQPLGTPGTTMLAFATHVLVRSFDDGEVHLRDGRLAKSRWRSECLPSTLPVLLF